jgi:uncharacterized protein (AIM24 family)
MSEFVRLWEEIKDGNVTELKKIITRANSGIRYSITTARGQYNVWLAHPAGQKILALEFAPGEKAA